MKCICGRVSHNWVERNGERYCPVCAMNPEGRELTCLSHRLHEEALKIRVEIFAVDAEMRALRKRAQALSQRFKSVQERLERVDRAQKPKRLSTTRRRQRTSAEARIEELRAKVLALLEG